MSIASEAKEVPWHGMSVSEVVSRLGTDQADGLSSEEAEERLRTVGANVVSRGKRRIPLVVFLSQFTDPLVVVLLAASVITFALREYVDTGVILAVVVINAAIGFLQEEKAHGAIESLSKLMQVETVVLRGGSTRRVSAEVIVPGDVVLLQSGDRVPADLRIVEERNLRADESILTGESAPVSKSPHPVQPDYPVSDRACMAYSGTLIAGGFGKGIVVATGDASELGRISRLIVAGPDITTPLTRSLARFGKWLSAAVLGVSALTFALGVLVGRDPRLMFSAAVAMAVAMIPEGLPAILTIVLAVGVKRMADRHAIIRTLPAVETLGSVTVICSDKTGTLTANAMTVSHAYASGNEYEFGGIGYDPRRGQVVPVDTDDSELRSEAFVECLRCGLLCNESELIQEDEDWIPSGDPTEVALIVAAVKAGLDPQAERKSYPRLDAVPFESSNMYMATLNARPDGSRVVYVKGSLERLLGMCSSQMVGSTDAPVDTRHLRDRADDLARQGLRILAFARKLVASDTSAIEGSDLADMVLLGIQAMSDPPRPEAIEAVRECENAGVEVKMITGDHVYTAEAIARAMGIGGAEPDCVTGAQLTAMEAAEFDRTACSASVFARVAPEQKYRLVESLRSAGEVVAMTGDGVNDAPALKNADIGVALGKAGSEVAKDASDMVIADDNFASIVAAVEEGRTVFSNLVKTLTFILPTNVGEGLIIIVALLGGYVLPVTPVQLLWINTVTTVTLALPLAFEPREQGLMTVPPRDPKAPIISRPLVVRMLTVGLLMLAAAFAIFSFERSMDAKLQEARAAAVTTIVAIESVYLFLARSDRTPLWKLGLFSNPQVWIGVPVVALLQLGFVYLPLLNFFFGSAPLPAGIWLRIGLAAFPIVLVVGAEKMIRHRFAPKDSQPPRICKRRA